MRCAPAKTETFDRVLGFLGLRGCKPEAWEARNTGGYGVRVDPATRRRLEEYFEPHNRRLCTLIGTDFGW